MMLGFSYTFHVLAQLNSEQVIPQEFIRWSVQKRRWGILYQHLVQQCVAGVNVERQSCTEEYKKTHSFV